MISSLFVAISDAKIDALVGEARNRVALAVPGFGNNTSDALISAVSRLGAEKVVVIVDCDEEVFRLGYGDIKALQKLQDSGHVVRQSSRLRVGVLVCDEAAWVFAPTALYVEAEVHSDETPNAVELKGEDVERILARIIPKQSRETLLKLEDAEQESVKRAESRLGPELPQAGIESVVAGQESEKEATSHLSRELAQAEVEVGTDDVSTELLQKTTEALAQAPPVAFDVARQVRVFQPYIQYVDISLKGCAIERRTVELPRTIQGLDPDANLSSRLHMKFDLIEKSSDVSSEEMDREVKQLRDNFTRSLGKPWGRVLLRNLRTRFDAVVKELQKKLESHKAKVESELNEVLSDSKARLIGHLFPLVEASPPDALRGQIINDPPTSEQIIDWLDAEIDKTFPKPSDLMSEMKLEVQFRDVTYETLKQPGFEEKLRDAYKRVDWDKPFDEFDAAKSRDSSSGAEHSET